VGVTHRVFSAFVESSEQVPATCMRLTMTGDRLTRATSRNQEFTSRPSSSKCGDISWLPFALEVRSGNLYTWNEVDESSPSSDESAPGRSNESDSNKEEMVDEDAAMRLCC
jgi:hypothetical protein